MVPFFLCPDQYLSSRTELKLELRILFGSCICVLYDLNCSSLGESSNYVKHVRIGEKWEVVYKVVSF